MAHSGGIVCSYPSGGVEVVEDVCGASPVQGSPSK